MGVRGGSLDALMGPRYVVLGDVSALYAPPGASDVRVNAGCEREREPSRCLGCVDAKGKDAREQHADTARKHQNAAKSLRATSSICSIASTTAAAAAACTDGIWFDPSNNEDTTGTPDATDSPGAADAANAAAAAD